ncbi:L-threonine aldolase [Bradyrhizobium sp. Rc3b]|uniref:GntG family PLP-dependent aldolase n=1 Tax=Bradyrhizobium sp. Rc3b TaxID=1855322 RepID=UPI0008DEB70C|nr:GntG family PLP-dependent aldolase [Bradyrhizobium sp. Rc3b]SFN94952.1 L-threonine aldolase [Bradyrhizobium sp. Rc3b]
MQKLTAVGPLIDLRSDTVTRPTPSMFDRMASAELGDDGRGDDPTVKELERVAAALLGKEAALFLPSGTMSNHVAILSHSFSRGEVIGEASSHIFRSEMGGLSLLAGLYPRPIPGRAGAMDLEELDAWLRPPGLTSHALGTAVVCMETTHSVGGAVLSLDHMRDVCTRSWQAGVPVHLDGARLFNAAIGLGVPASAIAAFADSATFCLSKGLSAPVGSVLAGSCSFIERARGFRKMLGGNLRQAGLLAACGLVALEESIERLADDHLNARRLADGLHRIDPHLVSPADVATNMVVVNVGRSAAGAEQWIRVLSDYGVLTTPASTDRLRLVVHRHVDVASIDRVLNVFAEIYLTRPATLFAV